MLIKKTEIWMNKVNTTFNSTEDMINKLKSLKGKAKLKFYKNKSNYYNNLSFRMDEYSFTKYAQGISKTYHKVFLLTKLLQTKPQVKSMIIKFYDIYYTVFKNRDDKDIIVDKNENDYINFNDFITLNHYNGRKNDNVIFK